MQSSSETSLPTERARTNLGERKVLGNEVPLGEQGRAPPAHGLDPALGGVPAGHGGPRAGQGADFVRRVLLQTGSRYPRSPLTGFSVTDSLSAGSGGCSAPRATEGGPPASAVLTFVKLSARLIMAYGEMFKI